MISLIKELYNDYKKMKLEQSILSKYDDICRCPLCDNILNDKYYILDDIKYDQIYFRCRTCDIKVYKPVSFLKSDILQ